MKPEALLPPEEAQRLVLEQVSPLGPEQIPLAKALGRVLAEAVAARADLPPADNSAMDGFAVRSVDVAAAGPERPVRLEVIEEIPAGRVAARRVGQGQASRVMTGAPLPLGADAVIPVEQTRTPGRPDEQMVEVWTPAAPGTHIRRRGSDVAAGSVVLRAGTECGPAEVGALAALGRPVVTVGRRPTVAILATGDELSEPHEPLAPGMIVNSNSPTLAALARRHGAVPVVLPIAPDRREALRAAFASAMSADFILSSGGVSVGDHDYVKEVLAELGARTVFWRVAMKPGKPLHFSVLGGKPCFGLPGNPVSSMVSFLQFVRPAIRRAAGYRDDDLLLPAARAVVDGPVGNPDDRRGYLRAALRLDGSRLRARVIAAQGSHQLTSLLEANGLVVLEPGETVEAGGEATVQVIGAMGQSGGQRPGFGV